MKPLHHPYVSDILAFVGDLCPKLRKVIFHVSFDSEKEFRPLQYKVHSARLLALSSLIDIRFKYVGALEMLAVRSRLYEVFPCLVQMEPRCSVSIEIPRR